MTQGENGPLKAIEGIQITKVDHEDKNTISKSIPYLNLSASSNGLSKDRCRFAKKKARKLRQIRNNPQLEMIDAREKASSKSSWVSEMMATMSGAISIEPVQHAEKRISAKTLWASSPHTTTPH